MGDAFNNSANAFTLHDGSNFENKLHQSSTSIHSNPFNDSVSAFAEISPIKATYSTTPKKDFEFMSTNNSNINAIFNSYTKNNEPANDSGCVKEDVKNPFSAGEKNTWNELNALDLSRLQMEFNSDESNSSIFSNANPEPAKLETKKEIPVDFFNDVAKAAFNEFNNSRHKNNEFFNKISGFDCVRT